MALLNQPLFNQPLWDDHAWDALPSLETDASCDVCVIGLGGSGLSAVLEALRLGSSVIGIDAVGVGAGAAGRNGGFLLAGLAKFYHDTVAQLGRARAARVYALTLEEIERFIALTPNAVRRVGSLRIASSSDELEDCHAHLQALRADGFAAEEYSGLEGTGILMPTDGVMNPLVRVRALAQKALQRGAKLFEQTRAFEIEPSLVRTAQGQIRAKHIIVAVDGKLEVIFPELAPRVRTTRLQMLGTAPTEPRFTRAVYARWGYEYWQQLPDGCITIGGFRDQFKAQEWTLDNAPSDALQAHLEHYLRQDLGIDAPITHRWAASVSYTADSVPIFEQIRPGVWALGAYNGTGNVIGAMLGRAAVQMALESHSSTRDALFGA
jgi:gamma-glutamylputrescine oxidase